MSAVYGNDVLTWGTRAEAVEFIRRQPARSQGRMKTVLVEFAEHNWRWYVEWTRSDGTVVAARSGSIWRPGTITHPFRGHGQR